MLSPVSFTKLVIDRKFVGFPIIIPKKPKREITGRHIPPQDIRIRSCPDPCQILRHLRVMVMFIESQNWEGIRMAPSMLPSWLRWGWEEWVSLGFTLKSGFMTPSRCTRPLAYDRNSMSERSIKAEGPRVQMTNQCQGVSVPRRSLPRCWAVMISKVKLHSLNKKRERAAPYLCTWESPATHCGWYRMRGVWPIIKWSMLFVLGVCGMW